MMLILYQCSSDTMGRLIIVWYRGNAAFLRSMSSKGRGNKLSGASSTRKTFCGPKSNTEEEEGKILLSLCR
jgi:hypothetical protein